MGRLRLSNETKTSLIVLIVLALTLIAIGVFLILYGFGTIHVHILHPGSFEAGIVLLSIIALFILLLVGRCYRCNQRV
jgi:membrane protein implicated in regulation of membrane protease activity